MKRVIRTVSFLLLDVIIAAVSLFAAVVIVHEFDFSKVFSLHTIEYLKSLPLLAICAAIAAFVTESHKVLWQFASAKDMLRLSLSSIITVLLFAGAGKLARFSFTAGLYVTSGILTLIFMLCFRVATRFFFNRRHLKKKLAEGKIKSKIMGNLMDRRRK